MSIVRKNLSLESQSAENLLSEFIEPDAVKSLVAEYTSLYNILLHTSER